jgi:hypothetical protein
LFSARRGAERKLQIEHVALLLHEAAHKIVIACFMQATHFVFPGRKLAHPDRAKSAPR